MPFILVLVVIVAVILWWKKSQQTITGNERAYLRSRGYVAPAEPLANEPRGRELRLLTLLESLDDITPYARERAAEEIALLCESGQADERMLGPLVSALGDSNAAVRGAVATALGKLGDARAVEALRRVADSDQSVHARAHALSALQKLERAPAGDQGGQ